MLMPPEPILEVRHATRRFPGHTAVRGASFTLREGAVTALLGPSGCGKSTLLRAIAGLERIDEGEILIRGQAVSTPTRSVEPERRGVGLVFQDNSLFPHLDVHGNVAFGIKHLAPSIRQSRVIELLARFHIEHLERSWPHMLSGGEQQRVAIARALAREPSLLLLDEPFSGLDGTLRETVRQSLMADLRAAGATVLVVTHDREEAMTIADELVLMDSGAILQVGSPEQCYRHPVSAASARLLGESIVFPATVEAGVAQTPFGPVLASALPDGRAELVVRPDAITPGDNGVVGTVANVRFVGNGFRVDLVVAGCNAAIRVERDPPAVGTEIMLTIAQDAATVHALPEA